MLAQLLRLTLVSLKLTLIHLVLVLSSKDLLLLLTKSLRKSSTHWLKEPKVSSKNSLGPLISRKTSLPSLILLILILLLSLAPELQLVSIFLTMTISDRLKVSRTSTLAMCTLSLKPQISSLCTREILTLW